MSLTLDIFVYMIVCIIVIIIASFFNVHWAIIVVAFLTIVVLCELAIFFIDNSVK